MVLLGAPKTPARTVSSEQMQKPSASSGSSSMLRMLRRGSSEAAAGTAAATAEEPCEFNISVDKSTGSSLGLGLGLGMVITSMDAEGLVAAWNDANPGKEVKIGHRIIQVNGKSQPADIVEKLKAQELLELRVSCEAPPAVAESMIPPDGAESAEVSEATKDPPIADSSGAGSMKASGTDVTSEETASPGICSMKNKFDASNEFNAGADGTDGDLVELPSPSIHTSLLSHSLLTPRDPSFLQPMPSRESNGTSWSAPGAEPTAPGVMPSPLMEMSSTSRCPPTVARSISSPPDDNEGQDIAAVHSSLTTHSPSMHQALGQDASTFRPYAQEAATAAAAATPGNDAGYEQRLLQMHGIGQTPEEVGFLGAGPFWTCGSAPSQRPGGAAPASSSTFVSGLLRNSTQSSSSTSSGDLSSRISGLVGNCINLLANAIDLPNDPEPPEDELTTIVMETKEQRLQWRDFLSEAVSKCHAGALYNSFDVEPVPPRYARPPLSTAPKVDAIVTSYRQTGKTPPHVVAPNGAGWSPIGPHNPRGADDRGAAPWVFSGGLQVDPEVEPVQDVVDGDNGPSGSSSSCRPTESASSESQIPQRSATDPDVRVASFSRDEHSTVPRAVPRSRSGECYTPAADIDAGDVRACHSWPPGTGSPRPLFGDVAASSPAVLGAAVVKNLDAGVGADAGLAESSPLSTMHDSARTTHDSCLSSDTGVGVPAG